MTASRMAESMQLPLSCFMQLGIAKLVMRSWISRTASAADGVGLPREGASSCVMLYVRVVVTSSWFYAAVVSLIYHEAVLSSRMQLGMWKLGARSWTFVKRCTQWMVSGHSRCCYSVRVAS